MWMSSSSAATSNVPASSSAPTVSSPRSIALSSSLARIPALRSARACAFEARTSCGHRRMSNEIEALSRRNSGSWGSGSRVTVGPE